MTRERGFLLAMTLAAVVWLALIGVVIRATQ